MSEHEYTGLLKSPFPGKKREAFTGPKAKSKAPTHIDPLAVPACVAIVFQTGWSIEAQPGLPSNNFNYDAFANAYFLTFL